ncbi:MAG: hypothetical protein IJ104_00785 [Methanobrevibacter sp.]|nr:hypothetical protein [Methanobrevibacter sp.]MBQ9024905.1 hypothetical protein [Methanobrevibacter sp.]
MIPDYFNELYPRFVEYYNKGYSVNKIKKLLGIGSTKYYRLFQEARKNEDIKLRRPRRVNV